MIIKHAKKERINMKKRIKQRKNRRKKEEILKRTDICGVKDPTPFEAVINIIEERRRQ